MQSASIERILRDEGKRGVHTLVAGVSRAGERTVASLSPAGAPAPDGRTLFEIGSITKVFTGTLLADMHLRGEVDLSDPLSRHLPAADAPSWRQREPTLAELATHRSALPNTPRPLAYRELLAVLGVERGDPWAGVPQERYREMLRRTRPRRAPGGRVRYSSAGFGLLGDALAQAAGSRFEALLEERVCAPLALTDTCFEPATLPQGRSRRGAPRPPLRDWMPAAGSLRSSADDVLTFLEACLTPGTGPLGQALQLAQQPRAPINKHLSVGLGWLTLTRPGHAPIVWHNGGTWGFRSVAAFVPGDAFAVVVLANTTRSVDRLGLALVDEL
jgi:D-alanyl-D-alanine-carboxypeptidase/D-alanyl-D-alanine-endopeptidase